MNDRLKFRMYDTNVNKMYMPNDFGGVESVGFNPYKLEDEYPPFTAEKQIEILCFIVNNKHSVTFHDQVFRSDKLTLEKIQENLAWAINRIWQDLTSEEKQQVKGILE